MTDDRPASFRTRPVEVEAWHWNGTAERATNIIDWILSCGGTARYHDTPALVIDTADGMVIAHPGDWVVRGVKNEFSPLRDDIFRQTYIAQ